MSKWSANVALTIISLVVLVNYVDRYILAILVESIRLDLNLTDGQIGLLTGAAFALLYSTLAIPIARLAERHSRVGILFVSALIWSIATASCGLAIGFVSLVLARAMVGLGEAGAIAPSMSLVSDLFPMERRSAAMAIYGLGGSLGIALAPMIGSGLLPFWGWRWTLMIVGLAGIPAALLLLLVVREPPRGYADGVSSPATIISLTQALARLFQRRSFALLVPAFIALALAQYSMLLWIPSFFQRSFDISASEVGFRISAFQGIPLLCGTLLGGFIADWLAKHDARWIVWTPMLAVLIAAPAAVTLFATADENLALALLIAPSFAQGLCIGPCYALVQNLSAVHSRATAAAIFTFCLNIVGAGLGPLILGALSQYLSEAYGEESLRHALWTIAPLYLVAAILLFVISTFLKPDLEAARADSGPMLNLNGVTKYDVRE